MKSQIVVEAVLGKLHELAHGQRAFETVKLHANRAAGAVLITAISFPFGTYSGSCTSLTTIAMAFPPGFPLFALASSTKSFLLPSTLRESDVVYASVGESYSHPIRPMREDFFALNAGKAPLGTRGPSR